MKKLISFSLLVLSILVVDAAQASELVCANANAGLVGQADSLQYRFFRADYGMPPHQGQLISTETLILGGKKKCDFSEFVGKAAPVCDYVLTLNSQTVMDSSSQGALDIQDFSAMGVLTFTPPPVCNKNGICVRQGAIRETQVPLICKDTRNLVP